MTAQSSGQDPRPFGVPPQRTPVHYDEGSSRLRIGAHERHIDDPREPNQVYAAYLSLLYAVRGSKPGTQLPLRGADLEALLLIVGDDPDTIEQRLVGLMGCTAEEASALGALLLRHRRSMATLGITAGLVVGLASQLGTDVRRDADGTARGGVQHERALSATSGDADAQALPSRPAPTVTSVLLAGVQGVPSQPVSAAPADQRPAAVDAPAVDAPAAVAPAAADAPAVVVPADLDAPAAAPASDAEQLPVMDAPPPEPDAPDAAVGDAISLFEPSLEPISGVGGSIDPLSPEHGVDVAPGGGSGTADAAPATGTSSSSGGDDAASAGAAAPSSDSSSGSGATGGSASDGDGDGAGGGTSGSVPTGEGPSDAEAATGSAAGDTINDASSGSGDTQSGGSTTDSSPGSGATDTASGIDAIDIGAVVGGAAGAASSGGAADTVAGTPGGAGTTSGGASTSGTTDDAALGGETATGETPGGDATTDDASAGAGDGGIVDEDDTTTHPCAGSDLATVSSGGRANPCNSSPTAGPGNGDGEPTPVRGGTGRRVG